MNTPRLVGPADAGLIVLGWFTKLVLSLALLSLVLFDGIALLSASLNAADHANTAASGAADIYKTTNNIQTAFNAAEAEAAKNNETVDPKSFSVNSAGHVTLTIHRTASTLWMGRISFLKKYTRVTGTGEGSPAP
ncbi:MAG: hypothetical protein JWM40_28 [Frankiales bacterium]|nr:hypothetical protein [Frankiales bacterium]